MGKNLCQVTLQGHLHIDFYVELPCRANGGGGNLDISHRSKSTMYLYVPGQSIQTVSILKTLLTISSFYPRV